MSILRRERTYPFSLEGLALCKAESNKNLHNKLNNYNTMIFLSVLMLSIAGSCLLLNSLSSAVAYKSAEMEIIEVAYKTLNGVL